ncbi:MAG: bifunctional DNA-formamidopyrimidine glycosylase/DNA-(apurinic or apyrimidinic site) lyase [Planctomycetes bacterium]|nr:bifunctional DNA-formamidopyrimidine glycosylase/DNA-(apurinic or apyrimidinic site) lyase [Planctomycetota bacterium]
MPELPEVETICRGLIRHCVGAKVRHAHVHRPGFIRGSRTPAALFEGLVIARVHRIGKHFALESECGRAMLFHMGMSGSLGLVPLGSGRAAHVHVRWILCRDGKTFELHHKDPRRFGFVRPCRDMGEVRERWSDLGPDALAVTAKQLQEKFKNGKRAVKAALLDQSVTAGVGNIYADESLFQSGIHPLRTCGTLSLKELERLVVRLRIILKASIRGGGSTIQDHSNASGKAGTYQSRHQVYGRGAEPCRVCGTLLKQIVCQQRTTVFCPRCQPRRTAK